MSLSVERFDDFFRVLWGYDPFPWQTRLAKQVFSEGWPDCIDLPTASGKTAAIDVAVFVLACQSTMPTNDRTVGRRIFFTVNRRVIVDEAFDRSIKLAERLVKAEDGILKEVADALRDASGEKGAPPLEVVQLRGGIYRDRAWARSITQPIVVCTTADQLGSRLLFRGYGVSPSMQPVHAGLTACDSLILLDEAHVTKAFCETMQLLTEYQHVRIDTIVPIPRMCFVQMTATPAGNVKNRFALATQDRSHPILKTRQEASKPAELVPLGKRSVIDEIVKRALKAADGPPKAIGIIVNRVHIAREIQAKLAEEHSEGVHLIIGRMRPMDRDDLQDKLRDLVGPGRPNVFPAEAKPVFVVATQCLEVGADYDFDVLLTECASIDALRQRFGRLNRKGRQHPDGTPVEVTAAIVTNDASLKNEDPIYGNALKNTWDWLQSKKDASNQVDFGISRFKPSWEAVENEHAIYLAENGPKPLLSPAQHAAVLLPVHLDALCQTNPQPVPLPDVSYFIHGPQRDMAEVNVCWRADLGDDWDKWPDIVRLLPPTSPECMIVPLVEMKRWMGEHYKTYADADVPAHTLEVEDKRDRNDERQSAYILVWRHGHKPGDDIRITSDPRLLNPGDTIVMPVSSRSWHELGHIPNADRAKYDKTTLETDDEWTARCALLDRSVDVAERATRQSKLRVAIRLHDAFPSRADLRGLRASELRPLLRSMLEKEISDDDERRRVLAVLGSRIERHPYAMSDEENPESNHNELIVFKGLIKPLSRLALPASDEDDGDDDLSESNDFISLEEHTRHVVVQLKRSIAKLSLDLFESTAGAAAEFHDIGKADTRFQAMLAGVTPYEAMMRPTLLGKSDTRRLAAAERSTIRARANLPASFRHEMLSMQIVEHLHSHLVKDTNVNRDLLLHVIAAHHGYARPFAPVVIDDAVNEVLSIEVNDIRIMPEQRMSWTPPHRLDSGVAERFWKLTRDHGWWGLAWLESILRLADQQASAAEQEANNNE